MVRQSEILKSTPLSDIRKRSEIINEAIQTKKQTAFLSHSHKDMELVKRIQPFLQSHGWNVYVDWADASMPSSTNSETARKIKEKIKGLDWFLFLATRDSMASRWCPWEIGYADGVKVRERILIIPTMDSAGSSHGSEYLGLYRRIEAATESNYYGLQPRQGMAVFEPHAEKGNWIESLRR